MKVIVFGATGMVGQGVVREALSSPAVEALLIVGRTPSGVTGDKVRELLHADLFDYTSVERELTGYDACCFCLGVSAAGMKEADYRRITHDLTLAAARTLLRLNPQMTFIYVSGDGTDSTEKKGAMWARVKGQTENALLALGFARAYMFRPGIIQPKHGIVSKTRSYRILYAIMAPLFPLLRLVLGKWVTSTDRVGVAMLRIARDGYERPIVRNPDINELAAAA